MADTPSLRKRFPFPRRFVIGVLVLGAVLVAFFGWRAQQHYEHLQQMEAVGFDVESLRGWMTLPYIAERYEVPVETLYAALGVDRAGNDKASLRELIERYNLEPMEARRSIEQAILARRDKPGQG